MTNAHLAQLDLNWLAMLALLVVEIALAQLPSLVPIAKIMLITNLLQQTLQKISLLHANYATMQIA